MSDQISELPASSGIFALEAAGTITHLSASANLRRRLSRLVGLLSSHPSGQDGRESQNRFAMYCWTTESKLESSLLLYQLAKKHFPKEYLARLHLRMPWFTALMVNDRFPRLAVTNRIQSDWSPIVGPFARRDLAQLFEQEVQSAFLLRRCTETLEPHPEHPGCIYGEIRQCLRPCQGVVDEGAYRIEAAAVSAFLRDWSNQSLRKETDARDAAIASTDFERAATLHKRVERLAAAVGARDAVVRDVFEFGGFALVKEKKQGSVRCFPMLSGLWQDPVRIVLNLQEEADTPSIERALRSAVTSDIAEESGERGDRSEHLALFSRWYYSSWREGLWFSLGNRNKIPYRRMALAVRRMCGAGVAAESKRLEA